jgi:hypothetical protein
VLLLLLLLVEIIMLCTCQQLMQWPMANAAEARTATTTGLCAGTRVLQA